MKAPHIIHRELEGDCVRFDLSVPAGLRWFDGHFPGHPVLPGVVQVDWVYRLAREAFGELAPFAGLRSVKFHRLIGPDSQLSLLIERGPGRLDWRYRQAGDEGELCSEGRMRLREAE